MSVTTNPLAFQARYKAPHIGALPLHITSFKRGRLAIKIQKGHIDKSTNLPLMWICIVHPPPEGDCLGLICRSRPVPSHFKQGIRPLASEPYTLPTLVGVGHHRTESTSIGYNQWLSLVKVALKVPLGDKNRSLVANTSKCGEGITLCT
jgi:hypothetical protein